MVGNQLDPGGTFTTTTGWTWAYSADGNANSWTLSNQQNYNDFGCPGGTCPSTSPTGVTFQGLWADHSVAAVTDSTWGGPSGNTNLWQGTVVGASLTPNIVNGVYNVSDAVVLLSTDGGATWGNTAQGSTMQWLDTSSTGLDDMPFVFSNPESPHDTYAAWQTLHSPYVGVLRKIFYNLGTSPPTPTFGTPIIIPVTNVDNTNTCGLNGTTSCDPARFTFGFTTMPTQCGYSGKEGIFVVWTTIPGANGVRCQNPLGYYSSSNPGADDGPVRWNVAIFDTGANNGQGGWLTANGGQSNCTQGNCAACTSPAGNCTHTFATSQHFDLCVGRNTATNACGAGSPQPCPWSTNSPDPHIAVDPNPPSLNSDVVWITHTVESLALQPVTLAIEHGHWICNNGGWPL